jgi:GH18 family chitinase
MNANTDGSYTHMHWAFADIDPKTWKPIINDKAKQWDDFKKLQNMKRIVSLGGWAYSTEPATYNIIRQAIINNRDVFAANLAQFVKDEGIDGIDIDWEYPGAPDIMVGGQPIGQKTDGIDYLKFLTILKKNLGADKSVSIAAPASYWYLKAFPIDRITAAIDYIVYMTYDLHGQWDYGNPNAYDSCPSGKCIRSHGMYRPLTSL